MIFWHSVQAGTGRAEVVEAYHDINQAIADMKLLAWEELSNCYVDYLMDEQTGEAVAVALFGPELELMIVCADGRRLTVPMPESYREMGNDQEDCHGDAI